MRIRPCSTMYVLACLLPCQLVPWLCKHSECKLLTLTLVSEELDGESQHVPPDGGMGGDSDPKVPSEETCTQPGVQRGPVPHTYKTEQACVKAGVVVHGYCMRSSLYIYSTC